MALPSKKQNFEPSDSVENILGLLWDVFCASSMLQATWLGCQVSLDPRGQNHFHSWQPRPFAWLNTQNLWSNHGISIHYRARSRLLKVIFGQIQKRNKACEGFLLFVRGARNMREQKNVDPTLAGFFDTQQGCDVLRTSIIVEAIRNDSRLSWSEQQHYQKSQKKNRKKQSTFKVTVSYLLWFLRTFLNISWFQTTTGRWLGDVSFFGHLSCSIIWVCLSSCAWDSAMTWDGGLTVDSAPEKRPLIKTGNLPLRPEN